MHLLPLRSAPFTKLSIFAPPRTALQVYTTRNNEFTLFAVHEVGDACSATRHNVGIYHFASMRAPVSTAPSVKYEDILQAGYVGHQDPGHGQYDVIMGLGALLNLRMSS